MQNIKSNSLYEKYAQEKRLFETLYKNVVMNIAKNARLSKYNKQK